MGEDVDLKIASLGDWRGRLLQRIREIIKSCDPAIVEEVKWRKASNPLGVPTWSRDGIICTGESYKNKVKVTFMQGAALNNRHELFKDDPGGTRRAIDFYQDDQLDTDALTALVKEAVAHNVAKKRR